MGTKLKIWRQWQFYHDLGRKIIELPYDIGPGPSDHQVKIEGFEVQPDNDGNFLNGNYSVDELDAIHTYGVIRLVIDLYEEILQRPIVWSWRQKGGKESLNVRIKNNDINARFLLEQKCLELDYYGPYENWVYNCRTVDLIAHETGHAIMNSIFPEWQMGGAETRGMEEAFCDLTSMFLIISQYDLCEEVIRETNGDLAKNSLLSLFSVGHGHESNPYKEIRNANNKATYKANDWSPYSFCEVLVGVLYDVLKELFYNNKVGANDAAKLIEVGKLWMNAIIKTFSKCNPVQSNLKEFSLFLAEVIPIQQEKIKKHFKGREVC